MFNNKQRHLSKEEIVAQKEYLAEEQKQKEVIDKMIAICKEAGYNLMLQLSLKPMEKAEEQKQSEVKV